MISPLSSRRPHLISAAILAGGRAVRMGGAAKALLSVEGVAIVDRQIAVLRPRFAEILAVIASADDPRESLAAAEPFTTRGLRVVSDRIRSAGPMAGLHAALASCSAEWLFAVACDMPYLDGDLIDQMADLALGSDGADALVPVLDGRSEPLHAFYRASVAPEAERCLRQGRRAMTDLLSSVRTLLRDERHLPAPLLSRSCMNLNTAEEVAAVSEAGTASSGKEGSRRNGGL